MIDGLTVTIDGLTCPQLRLDRSRWLLPSPLSSPSSSESKGEEGGESVVEAAQALLGQWQVQRELSKRVKLVDAGKVDHTIVCAPCPIVGNKLSTRLNQQNPNAQTPSAGPSLRASPATAASPAAPAPPSAPSSGRPTPLRPSHRPCSRPWRCSSPCPPPPLAATTRRWLRPPPSARSCSAGLPSRWRASHTSGSSSRLRPRRAARRWAGSWRRSAAATS